MKDQSTLATCTDLRLALSYLDQAVKSKDESLIMKFRKQVRELTYQLERLEWAGVKYYGSH